MGRVVPCFVFDDMWSYLHTLWGMLTRIAVHFMPWLSLLMFTGFVIYEVVEDRWLREVGRAKCDIMEYVIGYTLADIVTEGLLGA